MNKKIITFGEIMLRLATPEHQRFTQMTSLIATFGGGEANVAVSLANYGLNTEFVTCLPENDLGHAVLMDLRKHNVGTLHIILGGGRLGIYFLETGAVSRPSKVIYDRQIHPLQRLSPNDVDEVFEGASISLTGIIRYFRRSYIGLPGRY
jgi:2-dehydro-3-deoxygluconokinase